MGKNDITRRGLLHNYTDIATLIKAQANTPTFIGNVKNKKLFHFKELVG